MLWKEKIKIGRRLIFVNRNYWNGYRSTHTETRKVKICEMSDIRTCISFRLYIHIHICINDINNGDY